MTPEGLKKLAKRIKRYCTLRTHDLLDQARREESHHLQVGMVGRAEGYERAGEEIAGMVRQAAIEEEKACAKERAPGERG